MDHDEKKFYIEIATTKTLEALTKSAVLNLLTFAEQAGAEKVYVCCRKSLGDISKHSFMRSFQLNYSIFRILSQDFHVHWIPAT